MLTRAREEDAVRIAHLHVASWRLTYTMELSATFLARQDVTAHAEEWRRRLAQGVTVVLADEPQGLAGFVACGPAQGAFSKPAEWEIYNLHVARGRQGHGVGSRLFRAAAELGRERGAARLVLWVVQTNARARAFYEAKGMGLDGARQEHVVEDQKLDEVRYSADLADPSLCGSSATTG
jgi:ribosomal protein S18 acetylase RimI-like enzyme